MGYTGTKNCSGVSVIEMLRTHSSLHVGSRWESSTDTYEVFAMQPGKGGVYGILRRTSKVSSAVFDMALIVLISRDRKEFCWKEMTEFSGPYETGIPRSLFRRLTPLDQLAPDEFSEHAFGWRRAVETRYASEAKGVEGRPSIGDVITFAEPIPFALATGEVRVARFQVREWGRVRRLYGLLDDGKRFSCRLHRGTWSTAEFVVERMSAPPVALKLTAAPAAHSQPSLF
jgi:hypothetical protein